MKITHLELHLVIFIMNKFFVFTFFPNLLLIASLLKQGSRLIIYFVRLMIILLLYFAKQSPDFQVKISRMYFKFLVLNKLQLNIKKYVLRANNFS